MNPKHQLWAVALWVENQHSVDGPRFISEQMGRLVLDGDAMAWTCGGRWRSGSARSEIAAELHIDPPLGSAHDRKSADFYSPP
jgi:hypothetical protein